MFACCDSSVDGRVIIGPVVRDINVDAFLATPDTALASDDLLGIKELGVLTNPVGNPLANPLASAVLLADAGVRLTCSPTTCAGIASVFDGYIILLFVSGIKILLNKDSIIGNSGDISCLFAFSLLNVTTSGGCAFLLAITYFLALANLLASADPIACADVPSAFAALLASPGPASLPSSSSNIRSSSNIFFAFGSYN